MRLPRAERSIPSASRARHRRRNWVIDRMAENGCIRLPKRKSKEAAPWRHPRTATHYLFASEYFTESAPPDHSRNTVSMRFYEGGACRFARPSIPSTLEARKSLSGIDTLWTRRAAGAGPLKMSSLAAIGDGFRAIWSLFTDVPEAACRRLMLRRRC
ncbi:hypothetical protein VXQ18_16465 [Brucella abortus]|nr:hypothetical protein [Brucella abortus]